MKRKKHPEIIFCKSLPNLGTNEYCKTIKKYAKNTDSLLFKIFSPKILFLV